MLTLRQLDGSQEERDADDTQAAEYAEVNPGEGVVLFPLDAYLLSLLLTV